MKHHTLAGQIKTIRENTKALRTYIQWKQCGTKAKYFKKSELEDKIFHLGVIIQTTDEIKVSRPARAQRRIFVGILGREYNERSREAIIGRLTKYAQESKNRFEKKKKKKSKKAIKGKLTKYAQESKNRFEKKKKKREEEEPQVDETRQTD